MRRIGRRIIVTGATGSGKSTLAAELARRLDVPFVELDALFWEPNWTASDDEVFRERVRAATAGDEWAIAGNYRGRTLDITWPRAETVVCLDLPLRTVLRRLHARSWRRWRTRELLWGTNYESFWKHLTTNDSLLLWAVKTHPRMRRWFDAIPTDPRFAHIEFVRLRSPGEVARWLEEVAPARADAGA